MLILTHEGRITAANPAACTMLDLPAEEVCRLDRDGLVDQEDSRWGIAVAESDRSGSAVGVARLRRGDGRSIEIEMTALRFRDEDGALQTCCILRDLTGRLAIERELEELSARLHQLWRGDELTGLQNRRGLLASGTQLLQFADRKNAPVQALLVDVDNLQELNEHLGHRAGDAALQAVAHALSVTFRKNDVMARIGGTQFLVLTLQLAEPDSSTLAARIRSHLGAPETQQFVGAVVEVCCGWSTRQAGERTSLEGLMARSERAMLESLRTRKPATSRPPAADLFGWVAPAHSHPHPDQGSSLQKPRPES